ncbi:MAG: hypothetical protein COU71_02585 [Parcubacteria group bacterium CG10_big_fil_rev_8_21_14_0_10_38_31]|nr:MAG: hypothetical protein COU71_02585 [Parcubacteria group bacterium CG10_big_fil_rev_8_21_14_0_10_38_31]
MKKLILSLAFIVLIFSFFVLSKSYAKEYAVIEDGNLVIYNGTFIPGAVPEGVSSEVAWNLFKGEIEEYTIEGKDTITAWEFGLPIETIIDRKDRIISYSKKHGWIEKSIDLTLEGRWGIEEFVSLFILSFIGILMISIGDKKNTPPKRLLFLCYASIFLSFLLAITAGLMIGKYSHFFGYFISLFVIGFASINFGKKVSKRYGMWGGILFTFGNGDIGVNAYLSSDKGLFLYIVFIISIIATSFLTVEVINYLLSRNGGIAES